MGTSNGVAFPELALSHFELYVRAMAPMESFYTERLGFIVSDRGAGPDAMVFLSRNPGEHHQLVLNPRPARRPQDSPLDHISFRVADLAGLRRCHAALSGSGDLAVDAVSHGTTWSLYFRDPEGNRLEVFADTPWHVDQPCKFAIDLSLDDDALRAYTEQRIRELPGFRPVEQWRKGHGAALGEG
ncbi:VOC family protein [Pseudomonas sp. MBLB4136]|uniref:VOC family protein n=1 Tax=Pseudomonas sp. MBLB4136 TaxID=3451558 RepID=UPI003F755470